MHVFSLRRFFLSTTFQVLAGKWVTVFQLRREASCLNQCGLGSSGWGRTQPESRFHRKWLASMLLLRVLLICAHACRRWSSLATLLKRGMGVVRTSCTTAVGRHALAEFQSAALPMDDRLGLIWVGAQCWHHTASLGQPQRATRSLRCRMTAQKGRVGISHRIESTLQGKCVAPHRLEDGHAEHGHRKLPVVGPSLQTRHGTQPQQHDTNARIMNETRLEPGHVTVQRPSKCRAASM